MKKGKSKIKKNAGTYISNLFSLFEQMTLEKHDDLNLKTELWQCAKIVYLVNGEENELHERETP